MIINNLMLKLKDRSDESISKVKDEFLSMMGNIESLQDVTVELNIRKVESNFDILLITKFETMEDCESYIVHPFHLNVLDNIGSNVEASAVVCYERA
jgi:hypothetical protein